MAKDPAFLFYVSDFLTGSMLMTNEQVGLYIRLLCVQHQHGGIIDKISFDTMVDGHPIIRTKFVETDEGYYNKRMMSEMERRSIKSENLSANARIRWEKEKQKQCKSNAKAPDLDMPIEDENANEDKDTNKCRKVFRKPTKQEIKKYCKERENLIDSEVFYDHYESNGWKIGGKGAMKDWKATIRNWERREDKDGRKGNKLSDDESKKYDEITTIIK